MASYVLSDGKTVKQKPSKIWWVLAVLVVLIIVFSYFVPIPWRSIKFSELFVLIRQMLTPQHGRTWSDYFAFMFSENLWSSLLNTLKMSSAGTIIGVVLAFPVAILSARNITKKGWIYEPVKFIVNLIRTIPAMVLAVAAAFLVGYNTLAGIIAVSIFSFGIMVKMLYESIETLDMNPFEALESSGAGRLVAFRYAMLPQIMPVYLSYSIYIFEMNIRASAVFGFVGLVGIGSIINENKTWNWDYVGATIIILFIVILIIQFASNFVRRKLQ